MTHIIQLAVAPVFLLTAVGTIIGVLTNRLARIVDRIRVLESGLKQLAIDEIGPGQLERGLLRQRLRLVYMAVACEVSCSLLVGLSIIVAFIDAFVIANLARLIAGLFILAMMAFIAGLTVFLREIFLAVASTRASMH